MWLGWSSVNGLNENTSDLVFLPTLGVNETESGFNSSNFTLSPTIVEINAAAAAVGLTDFNFWELLNWMFVVHYWGLLADFGQSAPTMFEWNTVGVFQNYGPVAFPATNNIFLNETLFELYYNYLNNTILPLYGYTLPRFSPLDENNRLNQLGSSNVTLRTLYSCTDITLKSPQSFIISVLVADWAFITTFFAIALLIGTFLHKRGKQNSTFLFSMR
jgi:hypothetical protein